MGERCGGCGGVPISAQKWCRLWERGAAAVGGSLFLPKNGVDYGREVRRQGNFFEFMKKPPKQGKFTVCL